MTTAVTLGVGVTRSGALGMWDKWSNVFCCQLRLNSAWQMTCKRLQLMFHLHNFRFFLFFMHACHTVNNPLIALKLSERGCQWTHLSVGKNRTNLSSLYLVLVKKVRKWTHCKKYRAGNSLKTNERPWANRSGRLEEMSDGEQFAQRKWAMWANRSFRCSLKMREWVIRLKNVG